MKPVAKYNLYKAISTVLTIGTPIITLASCSDLFVHRSDTAISAAGMFAILLSLLFFKDKIVEKIKVPSALIVSAICLILVLVIEPLIHVVKYVAFATVCASTIDELLFKRMYKRLEATFPNGYETYKYLGFLFTTTKKFKELKVENV